MSEEFVDVSGKEFKCNHRHLYGCACDCIKFKFIENTGEKEDVRKFRICKHLQMNQEIASDEKICTAIITWEGSPRQCEFLDNHKGQHQSGVLVWGVDFAVEEPEDSELMKKVQYLFWEKTGPEERKKILVELNIIPGMEYDMTQSFERRCLETAEKYGKLQIIYEKLKDRE